MFVVGSLTIRGCWLDVDMTEATMLVRGAKAADYCKVFIFSKLKTICTKDREEETTMLSLNRNEDGELLPGRRALGRCVTILNR